MDDEILETFNQMDPHKAPGIDRLPGNENWDMVGKDVLTLSHKILDDNKDISSLNDTKTVLIPKIKDPTDMTNFRLLSLCRVIYKIIFKVLENGLKVALPFCISQNQSAFVTDCMIHDNILIALELIHYVQSLKNGPNKGFFIKLDMSKAYDRIEWNFLGKIEKIMRCVQSVRYVVECNMVLSKVVTPKQGLRQEDPLSPYLFLFCMEALSRMLIHAQDTGIRASQNGHCINHLFFADDALLFIKNKRNKVDAIMKILTYPLSVFLSPRGTLEDMQSRRRQMWWACKEKWRGWRLLTLKDTLFYRVFSSKYFPNGDPFHLKKVDKPSYTWSSIFTEAKALESGFGWQVGDGNNINICEDNLDFEGLNNESLYVSASTILESKNIRRDYPRCGASVETHIQALKDCRTARAILTLGGLDGRLLDKDYLYYVDWLKDVMHILDRKVVEEFIMTLWNSWNNRNNFVFHGKEEESQKWEKPSCRTVKINIDATAELYAFEEGFKLVHSLNIDNAVFKTDCASLVNRFKKCKEDITIIGDRIREIYKTLDMFTTADVKWANRSYNNVADFICKYAILNNCNMLFSMDYPRDIHDIVIRDSFN
ncbi:reverse transcriptase [Gossypium australe]|uniref:Reverse transcriptase n=1 Tax=Gossypium australe TaxID=47621 RepID=A0A5B6VB21_9ROSI|nr:reverse transcriptase [Gossypium australe]